MKKTTYTLDEVISTLGIISQNIKELSEEHKRTEMAQQKTELVQQKTELALQKTEATVNKMAKKLEEVGSQLGTLHQERGSYTEVILMNSIEELLMKDFKLDHFISNFESNIKGDHIQLDAIGFTNSNRNEAIIVEVKTKLRKDDIQQLNKQLNRVEKFIPELKNKKKFGLLIALRADTQLIKEVNKAGYYFATVKNDLVRLKQTNDFKPIPY